MLTQLSLLDTPSFTSSPVLADGPLLPALPDGQMTAKSSPGPVRASRFRSRAKAPELLMNGTYGPTFSESSVPDGPLSSWESRLRQRLAKVGSSECDLTWKVSGTTAEGLLSRLVPSTPRTVEIDSGLLLEAGYWVTPTTRDHKDTPGMSLKGPDGRDRTDQLPRQVAAILAACRANEGTGDKVPPGRTGGLALKQEVQLVAAMWPTTTAQDGSRGVGTVRPSDTGIPLPQRIGLALNGLSATTGKRGVLNPAFPCWLMGYPIVWVFCGASAMQSLPRSRRK